MRGVKENQHTKETHVYTHTHIMQTYTPTSSLLHPQHVNTRTNTQLRYAEIGFTKSGEAPEQESGVLYSHVQIV